VVESIWGTYDLEGKGELGGPLAFAFVQDAVGKLGGNLISKEEYEKEFAEFDVDG
jgi:hypothetical protein